LSSQMAISIENALLYENLEEKVQERTSQLNEAYLEIEKKNHDITSSINYAKRIQNAMLPTREKIRESLPECFIYFKPRDIVSGDFYWFSEKILDDGTRKVVIAAVDCTGHGVPGAFMSLIGNELLHEIINLRDIVEADKVLGELHVGVNSVLRQNETENRDGMDLSLCIIDFEKKMVDFAGAKNPVFYIQNNEIFEMKASKMPIGGLWGKEEGARVFDSSAIKLSDSMPTYLYMTSDGYPDQFGGDANMKFMKKRLKALLLEIHKKPMDEQRIILRDTMKDWMGNRKQLDDMLVIGMKL
jgi:serine phosphatase RsbU (regulator of sigma subunit)